MFDCVLEIGLKFTSAGLKVVIGNVFWPTKILRRGFSSNKHWMVGHKVIPNCILLDYICKQHSLRHSNSSGQHPVVITWFCCLFLIEENVRFEQTGRKKIFRTIFDHSILQRYLLVRKSAELPVEWPNRKENFTRRRLSIVNFWLNWFFEWYYWIYW